MKHHSRRRSSRKKISMGMKWMGVLSVAALLMTFVLEILSRHSLTGAFGFIVGSPATFLFNTLIVLDTLALSMFFRRRLFVACTAGVLWLACGIVNSTLVSFRTLPFTFIDITLLKDAIKMFDVYFNLPQRILIVAGGILAVIAVIVLFIRAPKLKRPLRFRRALTYVLILFLLTFGLLNMGLYSGQLTFTFENLTDAYAQYGFPYCFFVTFVDVGIQRPADYSEDTITQLADEIETSATSTPESPFLIRPNIVFVQLESFFDPAHVKGLELSEDPIPTFTRLKNSCPSGYLTVPVIGGGTVNTEFEMLTGMTLYHFGAGEYPYNTVMKESAVESMCFNLKNLGYTCHAIHDYSGSFYNRNIVYPNMGFDSFTCMEYMQDLTYNALGWPKDAVLTDEIIGALKSTENTDFVYCVAVQSHGHYPTETVVSEEDSIIDEFANDTASYSGLDYYLQEIRDVDTFVSDLTAKLGANPEPTVVVFFGDHLPSLGLTGDDLDNGTLYQTEYLIWNNYSPSLRQTADRDLNAYQLGAYVTDLLSIHEGEICRLHQAQLESEPYNSETYLSKLQLLEYDMIYGDKQIFNGDDVYAPTAMQLGIRPITMDGFRVSDNALIVTGSGFTEYSEMLYDDVVVPTIFVSPELLVAAQLPNDGQQVSVGQVTAEHAVLSATKPMTYTAEN